MHKIIIVEGHDNIGKTTLLKQAFNVLSLFNNNITLEHLGAPNSDSPKAQMEKQKEICTNWLSEINWFDKHVYIPTIRLCDRSIFGEFVYSQFRNYKPDYLEDIFSIISEFTDTKILFLVISSDAETFYKFSVLGTKVNLNTKEYEKIEKAELISKCFIKLTLKLQNCRNMETEIVNTNMFDTLEDRENYIIDIFEGFIKKN